jgi:hypothetical protein
MSNKIEVQTLITTGSKKLSDQEKSTIRRFIDRNVVSFDSIANSIGVVLIGIEQLQLLILDFESTFENTFSYLSFIL